MSPSQGHSHPALCFPQHSRFSPGHPGLPPWTWGHLVGSHAPSRQRWGHRGVGGGANVQRTPIPALQMSSGPEEVAGFLHYSHSPGSQPGQGPNLSCLLCWDAVGQTPSPQEDSGPGATRVGLGPKDRTPLCTQSQVPKFLSSTPTTTLQDSTASLQKGPSHQMAPLPRGLLS